MGRRWVYLSAVHHWCLQIHPPLSVTIITNMDHKTTAVTLPIFQIFANTLHLHQLTFNLLPQSGCVCMWWKDEEMPEEATVMFQREGFEGDCFSEERCKIDPNDHLWHSCATHLPPLFPYSALDGEICSISNPVMFLKGEHVWSTYQPAETTLCRSHVNVWSWWHWFCYMFQGCMFRGSDFLNMCSHVVLGGQLMQCF